MLFLIDGPVTMVDADWGSSHSFSSPQNRFVGPILDMVVEATLDVEPATGVRTHRAERKAALMADIDRLGRALWRVAEHAEPAERIDALIVPDRRFRDRLPADAVKAVAAGDKVAGDFAFQAVLAVTHARLIGGDVVQADALPLGRPSGRRRRASIGSRVISVWP